MFPYARTIALLPPDDLHQRAFVFSLLFLLCPSFHHGFQVDPLSPYVGAPCSPLLLLPSVSLREGDFPMALHGAFLVTSYCPSYVLILRFAVIRSRVVFLLCVARLPTPCGFPPTATASLADYDPFLTPCCSSSAGHGLRAFPRNRCLLTCSY